MKKILGIFIFVIVITGCGSRSSCTETWYMDNGNNEYRSCPRNYTSKHENGYRLVDHQWFYYNYRSANGQDGYKMYTTENHNYYLVGKEEASFEVLDNDYARDRLSVYFQQHQIKGATNPDTFRVIGSQYSADDKQVFFKSELLPEAKPERFTVFATKGLYTYSTDGHSAFIEDKIINGADGKSFNLFNQSPQSLQMPKFIGYYWSYDQSHLYYFEKQIPIKLNMAKFRYLIGYLFTDGQKVIEIRNNEEVKIRHDIKLPVTILTDYLAVDAQNQVIAAEAFSKDLSEITKNIDGHNVRPITPMCPPTLDCSKALQTRVSNSYFEDGKNVYFVRGDSPTIYEFSPIFKRVANKPIYLFNSSDSNRDILIHNDTLYRHRVRYREKPSNRIFDGIKIHGELIGPIKSYFVERRTVFADNAGFIYLNLHEKLNDDPNRDEILRTDKAEDFGILRLSKQSLPKAAYIFENDDFIYVFWKNRSEDDIQIDKSTLIVQYNHVLERGNVPDDEAQAILILLGLIK